MQKNHTLPERRADRIDLDACISRMLVGIYLLAGLLLGAQNIKYTIHNNGSTDGSSWVAEVNVPPEGRSLLQVMDDTAAEDRMFRCVCVCACVCVRVCVCCACV